MAFQHKVAHDNYTLKKHLKFSSKVVTSDAQSLTFVMHHQIQRLLGEISCFRFYQYKMKIFLRNEFKVVIVAEI